ncbi:helix-turn-helix transcriptional regulator [Sandaracinobacteroides hominis]|uniref:helix-turn-helix transcriptional regulator n=1 Tax=Sandaracinobacteroides hominis TaxID=2780086 RepID=UPI0018F39ACB|nr:helix-turn-helix transcriptional regulator [Sandaracinobacteroides hominis]
MEIDCAANAGGVKRLTEGQKECLRLVYTHLTSKEIARVLGISPHTVDQRLKQALKTIGVPSRTEAAKMLIATEGSGYQRLVYQTDDRDASERAKPRAAAEASPYQTLVYQASDIPEFSPTNDNIDRQAYAGPNVDYSIVLHEQRVSLEHNAHEDQSIFGSEGLTFGGNVPLEDKSEGSFWGRQNNMTASKRIGIILVLTFLAAMTFTSVLSGLQALSAMQH